MIGKTISHYRILEKIGEGGMGIVYKAEDLSLERTVAIKMLPRQVSASAEERERFKREAKAAAALNHPNIATIYGIEELEDETLIVMEYIEGRELKEQIRSGRMSLDKGVGIATQIAQGLQAAHRKGIVHRDIKSSNIMISDNGQVKVMDFGLAKVRGAVQVTKEGTTVGTAAYMSPEQARGEPVDQRSDIWSFGVVLHEMFTGERPFASDYEQAVVYSILNEEPKPLTEVRPGLPAALEQIVRRTLAKRPGDRYQSIDDTLQDLKALQISNGEVTAARGVLTEGSSKRIPVLVGMAAGVVILLVALYLMIPSTSESIEGKSIAVLPFENLNKDVESEYFSDGITEDIITQLSKIGELRVISRTSSMRYKGSDKTLREIGQELSVASILEGSIRRSGDRVRITSQLINARTDKHLWAETYDRDLRDIFQVQSEVAQHIATALQATLSPAEKALIEKQPTQNLTAYDYYLKGREYYRKYRERDNEYAIDLFKRALELDPEYALSYAGLGDAFAQRHWRFGFPGSWLDSSMAMSRRALEIDPNSAEAYKALGLAYEYRGWLHKALDADQRAVALNPNYQSAVANTGWVYWMLGELDMAYRWMERSVVLNPADAQHYFALGTVLYTLGENVRAREYLDKALDIQPDFEFAYWGKANLLMVQEMHGEADALCRKFLELTPEGFTALSVAGEARFFAGDFENAVKYLERAALIDRGRVAPLLAVSYHRLGREEQARSMYSLVERGVQEELRLGSEHSFIPYALARVRAAQGNKEETMRNLEKAVQMGYRWQAYLMNDPSFEDLREEPRFIRLMAEVKAKVDRMRSELAKDDR